MDMLDRFELDWPLIRNYHPRVKKDLHVRFVKLVAIAPYLYPEHKSPLKYAVWYGNQYMFDLNNKDICTIAPNESIEEYVAPLCTMPFYGALGPNPAFTHRNLLIILSALLDQYYDYEADLAAGKYNYFCNFPAEDRHGIFARQEAAILAALEEICQPVIAALFSLADVYEMSRTT